MDSSQRPFTPVDVLRRVTAMGVIANATTLWSYMRGRLQESYPELAATAAPTALPVDEAVLCDWLDDFVDAVEVERSHLSRRLNPS